MGDARDQKERSEMEPYDSSVLLSFMNSETSVMICISSWD